MYPHTRETYSSFPRTSISTRYQKQIPSERAAVRTNQNQPRGQQKKEPNLKSSEWKFVAEAVLKMTRRLFCAVARSPLPRRHPGGGGGNRRTKAFPPQRKLSEKYTFQMLQTRSDANLNARRVILPLCFDLVPSARTNSWQAKPKITNTTNNSINDKRQTYASLQFSFYFCDKYLMLSS